MIFPESAGYLTALPRVSLNGKYQDKRILPVLTSGAATAMWNGFRRIDAAYLSTDASSLPSSPCGPVALLHFDLLKWQGGYFVVGSRFIAGVFLVIGIFRTASSRDS